MARRKDKRQPGRAPDSDVRTSNTYLVAETFGDPLSRVATDGVVKGVELLGSGASAIGGLARAGLRAAGSVDLGVVSDAAASAASNAAGAVVPAAQAALGVAGDVLSNAGELAGPALEASGEIAGAVLGAVAEAAGDVLST